MRLVVAGYSLRKHRARLADELRCQRSSDQGGAGADLRAFDRCVDAALAAVLPGDRRAIWTWRGPRVGRRALFAQAVRLNALSATAEHLTDRWHQHGHECRHEPRYED